MKLKHLIPKLQALNPEAEAYVYGGASDRDSWGPKPLDLIRPGFPDERHAGWINYWYRDATPSDTLIVLSE